MLLGDGHHIGGGTQHRMSSQSVLAFAAGVAILRVDTHCIAPRAPVGEAAETTCRLGSCYTKVARMRDFDEIFKFILPYLS